MRTFLYSKTLGQKLGHLLHKLGYCDFDMHTTVTECFKAFACSDLKVYHKTYLLYHLKLKSMVVLITPPDLFL